MKAIPSNSYYAAVRSALWTFLSLFSLFFFFSFFHFLFGESVFVAAQLKTCKEVHSRVKYFSRGYSTKLEPSVVCFLY